MILKDLEDSSSFQYLAIPQKMQKKAKIPKLPL